MENTVGVEAIPVTESLAVVLCFIVSSLSSCVGLALIAFPNFLCHFSHSPHDNEENHNNTHETTRSELELARLTGGLFVYISFTSLLPIVSKYFSNVASTRTSSGTSSCRVIFGSHALLGLILVLVGLINYRDTLKDEIITVSNLYLLGIGAFFLILSCIGLMISFWPADTARSQGFRGENDTPSVPQSCLSCWCLFGSTQSFPRQHLLEPLLPGNPIESDETIPHVPEQSDFRTPSSDREQEDARINSRIRGTRRLIKLAAPQIRYLYLGCVVLLIRLPFSLSIPHFVSSTLGALSRGDYLQAKSDIILLFILGSIDAILDFWCVFLFGYAKERIVRGVRIDLLAALLRQDVSFFDCHTTGDLSSRLSSDCGEMAGDLTWFFRFSIESFVRITGITIYMLIRCPTLGGCALTIVPLVAVINKIYGDWLRKNAIQVQDALARANAVAQETLSCVRTVIGFAAEESELGKYKQRVDDHYRLNILQLMMTGMYYMAVSTFLINTVIQSVLLIIGMELTRRGQLTSEILLAFMLYQGQLQNETMNLFNSYSSLIKSSGAGDQVFQLLDRIPPPPGTGNCEVLRSYSLATNIVSEEICVNEERYCNRCVKLQDVCFSYPSRPSHPVLIGLNLDIPAGSTMALVGISGCGKTTIVSLLKRFYDPISGSILIDDNDLRSIDLKLHRQNVGVVSQDPILFTGSILSNITFGSPTATLEDAIEAAKLANAHSFVMSFPEGYDTEVGERGLALSGGQKQRIAIARAIVKKPSILLLDEATSALDAESESVVQEALDRLTSQDMTTIVVAHRLRTVRRADCIAFIQDGRVVEQGSHEELMKNKEGNYRKMVERAGDSGRFPDIFT